MARKKVEEKSGINVWVPESKIKRLDAHLEKLTSKLGVPGAKISRSAFLAALLDRELEKDGE